MRILGLASLLFAATATAILPPYVSFEPFQGYVLTMSSANSLAIGVFCSSSDTLAPAFVDAADELGALIAQRGHRVVFGGTDRGLMATLARAAHRHGGKTCAVVPEIFVHRGMAYNDSDDLVIVKDLHERKAEMTARSAGFIVLPGGIGTLDELFDVLALRVLGYHYKPIVILNTFGFYDSLLSHIGELCNAGFAPLDIHRLFTVVSSPPQALDIIEKAQLQDEA